MAAATWAQRSSRFRVDSSSKAELPINLRKGPGFGRERQLGYDWRMILVLIAAQMVQPQTAIRTAPNLAVQPPPVVDVNPSLRKERMMHDARRLLKQAQGIQANYQPAAGAPSKAELDTMVDTMKSDLDSMSEMGEMESLRLQMAMDRMSKMMSALSNLLKKISDTQNSITQNLK